MIEKLKAVLGSRDAQELEETVDGHIKHRQLSKTQA